MAKNEPLLGPRARNIHIPVARREGPLKGPHRKWPKMAQKWPKIDPFEGVESLPNPIARALFGVRGAAREGRPKSRVQKWSKRASQTPNWGSQTLDRGPPDPQTPKMTLFGPPFGGVFTPQGGDMPPFRASFWGSLQVGASKTSKNGLFGTPSGGVSRDRSDGARPNLNRFSRRPFGGKRCRLIWTPKWPFLGHFLRGFWEGRSPERI